MAHINYLKKILLPKSKPKQLTLFRMDFFGAARGWEGPKSFPLPKIRHTYVTVMKLRIVIPYLRKIQKIYESCNSTLEFC